MPATSILTWTFGAALELIFRVHPEVRRVDAQTYCIGAPAHSPHVLAQVRLAAGERFELELSLPEGAYLFRGPQLPYLAPIETRMDGGCTHVDLTLTHGFNPQQAPTLKAGRQVFVITNGYEWPLLVRLERTIPRKDVLTAAQAASMALFRELFPGETLRPGQLMSVATVTLMVTEVDNVAKLYTELGDARIFEMLREYDTLVQREVEKRGGVVVKSFEGGMLASFEDPVVAVQAALDLPTVLASVATTSRLKIRLGVHRGAALVTTIHDRLDYFGQTVHLALRLPHTAHAGEVVVTQEVMADPLVAALVQNSGLPAQLFRLNVAGYSDHLAQRIDILASCPPMVTLGQMT